jgi:class 3 adenylate cyclase
VVHLPREKPLPAQRISPALLHEPAEGFGPAHEVASVDGLDGTSHPDLLPAGDAHLYVTRTFCFVDLSGFTAYTRSRGPDAAVQMLGDFRQATRNIAAKRGVRVAKWLGDGAMAVSTKSDPCACFAVNLVDRFADSEIEVRAGLATGRALLFEGDDYIGEPVNLAARLCSAADPGEVLADVRVDDLPDWVGVRSGVTVDIRGIGLVGGIHQLHHVG